VDAVRPPAYGLLWVVFAGIAVLAYQSERVTPVPLLELVAPTRDMLVIILIAWFCFRFISRVEAKLLSQAEYGRKPVDRNTVDALGKLARLTVLIFALLVTLQTLGFSIAGVVAFGGVGGIAVGLASRALLANFFGGLTVYLDRPFSVGDWIRSPDRQIEGTVEHIGWRLTRIRTPDLRPLYVPNATFNAVLLENPSRMLNRRIYETIGLRHGDVGQIRAIVAEVRAMLQSHEGIDTRRDLMVNLDVLGPSSLVFFINAFTKTTEQAVFHTVKEDILLRTFEIIESHGAQVAR